MYDFMKAPFEPSAKTFVKKKRNISYVAYLEAAATTSFTLSL